MAAPDRRAGAGGGGSRRSSREEASGVGIGVGFFRSPACEGEEVEGSADAGTPHAAASSVRYRARAWAGSWSIRSDLGGQSRDGFGLLFGPAGPTSGPGRQVMRDDGPAGFAPSPIVLPCDTGRSGLRRPRQKAKLDRSRLERRDGVARPGSCRHPRLRAGSVEEEGGRRPRPGLPSARLSRILISGASKSIAQNYRPASSEGCHAPLLPKPRNYYVLD
ncbi:uncharacterized protein LOC125536295 [Triticum urartu]|uniref:uncharacterized protein LOC125536295 n=1 Tax=Triticum urartu TaxID=4572 RepID=UPI002042F438|nr:uncharacterized protein LOC125536295 [Triticum urartu]